MSKTIVLAVDAARHESDQHVRAAAEMISDVATPADKVVVLHVHEFAVGRFGRLQVDCGEGEGEKLVADIVAGLTSAGLTAEGAIREANHGHVARAIWTFAEQSGARMLVLGSSSRTDLPRVPLGSVASRLLHMSTLPVLVVPMRAAESGTEPAGHDEQAQAAATGAS